MKAIQQQYQSFFLLVLMVALQACTTYNPIARAETVEQKAYAAYGTFIIIQEQAAKLASSGQLSHSQLTRLNSANRQAKDIGDELIEVLMEYSAVHRQFMAGETSEDKFIIAMNNLSGWTDRLLPLTNNLISAVQGAQ